MSGFYRKVCRVLDPGQSLPYRDFFQDKKGAKKIMKMLREKGFRRIFEPDLWRVAKEAEKNLAA